MEVNPKDNDVFQLLKRIKDADGAYPQDLLSARRQGYLKQVAAVSGGMGLGFLFKNMLKMGKGAALTPTAGTLVEVLLVVAIVAEVSTVTYFYRDKLIQLIQDLVGSPKVEEVSNPPLVVSAVPNLMSTFDALMEEIDTVTPLSTPSMLVEQATNQPSLESTGGSQAVSTPDPTNNGNQYGLTPKPERTVNPNQDEDDRHNNQGGPNNNRP